MPKIGNVWTVPVPNTNGGRIATPLTAFPYPLLRQGQTDNTTGTQLVRRTHAAMDASEVRYMTLLDALKAVDGDTNLSSEGKANRKADLLRQFLANLIDMLGTDASLKATALENEIAAYRALPRGGSREDLASADRTAARLKDAGASEATRLETRKLVEAGDPIFTRDIFLLATANFHGEHTLPPANWHRAAEYAVQQLGIGDRDFAKRLVATALDTFATQPYRLSRICRALIRARADFGNALAAAAVKATGNPGAAPVLFELEPGFDWPDPLSVADY